MSKAKQKLVDTALRLFNRDGFHATGIDKILTESGVAKKTLYSHFPSKDDLIAEVLRQRDIEFNDWFQGEIELRANTAEEKLLVIFDLAQDWFEQNKFYGCLFIGAANEYPDKRTAIRAICAQHKCSLLKIIEGFAEEAGAKNPSSLALQLSLLLDGSTVTAQISNCSSCAKEARNAAKVLIAAAL